MKALFMRFVGILALAFGLTANAEIVVQEGDDSSAPGFYNPRRSARPQAVNTSTNFDVRITFSDGIPQAMPEFPAYGGAFVTAVQNHTVLPIGFPMSPTDVRELSHVTPEDFMVSTVGFFYRGVFNPPAPFNTQKGAFPYAAVDVVGKNGELVPFDQITAEWNSSDVGNLLKHKTSFVGRAHSPLAPGFDANGNIDTSSNADVPKARHIVLIGSSFFYISNASDIAEVRSIITGGWTATLTVRVGGVTKSKTLTLVPPVTSLRLVAKKVNGLITYTPEVPGHYMVLKSPTVGGTYTNWMAIQPGSSVSVSPVDAMSFVKIKSLPPQ